MYGHRLLSMVIIIHRELLAGQCLQKPGPASAPVIMRQHLCKVAWTDLDSHKGATYGSSAPGVLCPGADKPEVAVWLSKMLINARQSDPRCSKNPCDQFLPRLVKRSGKTACGGAAGKHLGPRAGCL